MSDWTGEPLRILDELSAFDAVRRFLEIWWEAGGRSEDNIAVMLSSMNRAVGGGHGAPGDIALWDDWREAVTAILKAGGSPSRDPLN